MPPDRSLAATTQSPFGRLCFRETISNGITVPRGTGAMEIYSLQGKLLFRHSIMGKTETAEMNEAVRKLPCSVFYVNFIKIARTTF